MLGLRLLFVSVFSFLEIMRCSLFCCIPKKNVYPRNFHDCLLPVSRSLLPYNDVELLLFVSVFC
jgi:hypothetical protein